MNFAKSVPVGPPPKPRAQLAALVMISERAVDAGSIGQGFREVLRQSLVTSSGLRVGLK
jgi:hypothetical protein